MLEWCKENPGYTILIALAAIWAVEHMVVSFCNIFRKKGDRNGR